MFSIGLRLLPYLMALGGLLLVVSTIGTVVGGAETASTPVAVADVSTDAPKARWLKLTGGGLYLPDAVVDEEVKKSTGARKVKAWYVPYVPPTDAVDSAQAELGGTTKPAAKKVVLVQFSPDEFLRNYPSPDQLKPQDFFRAGDVEGLRASNVLFPQRLKDYVRAEMNVPLENVVVVKFGDQPVQRGTAVVMLGVGAVVALLGVVWLVTRFRGSRPDAIPTTTAIPPPIPPRG